MQRARKSGFCHTFVTHGILGSSLTAMEFPVAKDTDRSPESLLVRCQRSQNLAHLVHAPRHGRFRYPENGPGLRMTQTFLEHQN